MKSWGMSPETVTCGASITKHKTGKFNMDDTLLFHGKSLQNNRSIQIRQRIFQMGEREAGKNRPTLNPAWPGSHNPLSSLSLEPMSYFESVFLFFLVLIFRFSKIALFTEIYSTHPSVRLLLIYNPCKCNLYSQDS